MNEQTFITIDKAKVKKVKRFTLSAVLFFIGKEIVFELIENGILDLIFWDMKTIIITTLICLPCLAVLNESESVLPNVLGLAYILILFALSRTNAGKKFCERLYNETEKLNEILFKWITYNLTVSNYAFLYTCIYRLIGKRIERVNKIILW